MKQFTPASRLTDLNFTLALGAAAFAMRLVAALKLAREPVWDGHYYHFGAERIAAGLGYSEDALRGGALVWAPWAHYPVGYSGFLAGIYRVFGSALEVAPIANAIISALTVVVAFRLARYFLSPRRAQIAGCLVAIHPGLIAYTAAVMTEGLASFLLLLAAWVAVRSRASLKSAAFHGLILGLATLVRPTSLVVLPLLLLIDFKSKKAALLRVLVASAVALLVLSPWTLRNCVQMDGCALVSTNGGWNLAIGALTETGRFRSLHASDGCAVVTGQVQQDRCWAGVGVRTIVKDPIQWLGRMPGKLSQTFNHESFIVEYLHEADPTTWTEALRAQARSVLTGFHRALLVVAALSTVSSTALLGFFAQFSKSRAALRPRAVQGVLLLVIGVGSAWAWSNDFHPFWPLAVAPPLIALARLPGRPQMDPVGRYLLGVMLTTALVHMLFFGDDRYHLVVSPVLCILAAAALRSPAPPDSTLGLRAVGAG